MNLCRARRLERAIPQGGSRPYERRLSTRAHTVRPYAERPRFRSHGIHCALRLPPSTTRQYAAEPSRAENRQKHLFQVMEESGDEEQRPLCQYKKGGGWV